MPHRYKSFLDEFKIEINKLVPLTPPELVEEAENLYKELLGDENTTEKQIHQAVSIIGRKEYPYRKAYLEICAGDEEQRLQAAVFERLDADVKKKVEELTKHGVLLDDYIRSRLFEEQLTGEERHQVTQAILLSEELLDTQCDDRARKRNAEYGTLVENWTKEADRLQSLIEQLRTTANEDPKWTGEINTVCDRLEEGWSIIERDPTEEEIVKEIEYWNTVLHEEE